MTIPPINYNPNYPEVDSTWADWQIQFIQNFTQLATAFSQNHVPLDDATAANRGNHTYVQIPELVNPPQTGASEFTIHNKNVEGQTNQIYFTYPGNSPVVQFTNYQLYTVASTDTQTTYFTFLPGKILVYFGSAGPSKKNEYLSIFLNPPVCRNIISINFCTKGSTPQYTSGTIITVPDANGIIKEIKTIGQINTPLSINYVVIANI